MNIGQIAQIYRSQGPAEAAAAARRAGTNPDGDGDRRLLVLASQIEAGRWHPDHNIPSLNRAYIAALEDPQNEGKLDKVVEIVSGIVAADPKMKWVADKVANGEWDPFHKGDTEPAPKGFDASNLPAFLAKAVARQQARSPSFNGAAARERAALLNGNAKKLREHQRRNGSSH